MGGMLDSQQAQAVDARQSRRSPSVMWRGFALVGGAIWFILDPVDTLSPSVMAAKAIPRLIIIGLLFGAGYLFDKWDE